MITHPDKVLFPEDGITKGEMAAYYDAIAPLMLPHIRRRPITMERFPSGIGRKGFIQKDVSKGFPAWLKRIETPKKGGVVNYPLANDQKSLEWLVNQNAITLHVWTSRVPNLGRPDVCVFDLDPSEDDEDALREAALSVDIQGSQTAYGFGIKFGPDGQNQRSHNVAWQWQGGVPSIVWPAPLATRSPNFGPPGGK